MLQITQTGTDGYAAVGLPAWKMKEARVITTRCQFNLLGFIRRCIDIDELFTIRRTAETCRPVIQTDKLHKVYAPRRTFPDNGNFFGKLAERSCLKGDEVVQLAVWLAPVFLSENCHGVRITDWTPYSRQLVGVYIDETRPGRQRVVRLTRVPTPAANNQMVSGLNFSHQPQAIYDLTDQRLFLSLI